MTDSISAAMVCGLLYVLVGVFGATVTGLLLAFPKELVAAIAGLALLGSIAGALAAAFAQEDQREAALITFLVTLSGVVIAGVGSAFWGVGGGDCVGVKKKVADDSLSSVLPPAMTG